LPWAGERNPYPYVAHGDETVLVELFGDAEHPPALVEETW
jgi:hypothetical protein